MQTSRTNISVKIFFTLCIAACSFFVLTAYTFAEKKSVSDDEGIQFFTGTWKEAVAKAQQENKPIFMDIYATWCGPCKLLKKNTFTDKEVANFYNKNFINISLDGEKGEGAQIAAALQLSAYPSLYYFNKDGQPVAYTMGYQQPEELIEVGKKAIEKLK